MSEKKTLNVSTLSKSFDDVSSLMQGIIDTPPEKIKTKELKHCISALENFKKYTDLLMDSCAYKNKSTVNSGIEKYLPDLNNLLLELEVYYGGKNIKNLSQIKQLAEKIYDDYLLKVKYELIPYINSRMFSRKLITGVRIIDAQHKALFTFMDKFVSRVINEASNEDLEKVQRFLIKYTHIHFNEEEKLMEESGYPRKRAHKSEHKDFVDMIEKIDRFKEGKNEVSTDDILRYIYFDLNQWFINHILKSDRDFVEFYKNRVGDED
ncbi:bacteriohemerythrin [Flexistipes sinusarabici]|uniref:bacteriohemerythrin n=1 Tax=Flexistipes sinusarabici TaxID=2352 RepID=UPI00235549E5|nr:hemerythrin family protein [Flexistipes sinusarabici]